MDPVESAELAEREADEVWCAVVACYGRASQRSAQELAEEFKAAYRLLHPRPHDGAAPRVGEAEAIWSALKSTLAQTVNGGDVESMAKELKAAYLSLFDQPVQRPDE